MRTAVVQDPSLEGGSHGSCAVLGVQGRPVVPLLFNHGPRLLPVVPGVLWHSSNCSHLSRSRSSQQQQRQQLVASSWQLVASGS